MQTISNIHCPADGLNAEILINLTNLLNSQLVDYYLIEYMVYSQWTIYYKCTRMYAVYYKSVTK